MLLYNTNNIYIYTINYNIMTTSMFAFDFVSTYHRKPGYIYYISATHIENQQSNYWIYCIHSVTMQIIYWHNTLHASWKGERKRCTSSKITKNVFLLSASNSKFMSNKSETFNNLNIDSYKSKRLSDNNDMKMKAIKNHPFCSAWATNFKIISNLMF